MAWCMEVDERQGVRDARGSEYAQDGGGGGARHERADEELREQERALPEIATLGLAEEERAVARGRRRQQERRQRDDLHARRGARESGEGPEPGRRAPGDEGEGPPDEPPAEAR